MGNLSISNPSIETRVLNQRPELRELVESSSAFVAWLGAIKTVTIDDEVLFVRGDVLRDRDQLILEWASRVGLLPQNAIEQALREEEET